MENIFFKYGIIIVGVVVIMLLISFAFSSLEKTIKLPEKEEKIIQGEKQYILIKLEELCSLCLKDMIDKDCYIKEIISQDVIDSSSFNSENILMQGSITPGKNTIKIKSKDNKCHIIKLE